MTNVGALEKLRTMLEQSGVIAPAYIDLIMEHALAVHQQGYRAGCVDGLNRVFEKGAS